MLPSPSLSPQSLNGHHLPVDTKIKKTTVKMNTRDENPSVDSPGVSQDHDAVLGVKTLRKQKQKKREKDEATGGHRSKKRKNKHAQDEADGEHRSEKRKDKHAQDEATGEHRSKKRKDKHAQDEATGERRSKKRKDKHAHRHQSQRKDSTEEADSVCSDQGQTAASSFSQEVIQVRNEPVQVSPPLGQVYQYDSLMPGNIRLLELHPGSEKSELECSLAPQGSEPYEALSYVWGTKNKDARIRIRRRDGSGVDYLGVTQNLLEALTQLRDSKERRFFWVDAISINQENPAELNEQVPMMAKIFNRALSVRVWLGLADNETPLAKSLINNIRVLKDFDHIVEHGTTCAQWVALANLMKREWFSRRWVVQEIALASYATLHCGNVTIPWSEFADAVALFQELADRVRKKFRSADEYQNDKDFIGNVPSLSASVLVAELYAFVRKSNSPEGIKLEKLSTLETLVSKMTSFKAARPHDIIYAVLALANDVAGSSPIIQITPKNSTLNPNPSSGLNARERILAITTAKRFQQMVFSVDYKKSFYEVCVDFLEFTTEKSNSLDMICRPWAPTSLDEILPSFIRTLKESSYGSWPDGYSDRKNADTLAGLPSNSDKKFYNASGKYPGSWKFYKDKKSMIAKGFVLDTVGRTCDAAVSGTIPDEWTKFGRWKDHSQPPPDDFWRTMVADRTEVGRDPPSYYKTACQQAFSHKVEDGDIETTRIMGRLSSQVIEKYLKRVQAVVWGRKLIRTKTHKFLGLTPSRPHQTRPGDLIVILLGCSVPVVLRCKDYDVLAKEKVDHYQFIGECYIHGMMKGDDTFGIKNSQGIEYEEFDIR